MRFSRWERLLEGLEQPLVFYDTEATSPNPKHARVVEFGVAMYGPASMLEAGAEPDDATREALVRSLVPGLLYAARWRVAPSLRDLDLGSCARAERVHGIKLDGDLYASRTPGDVRLAPGVLAPEGLHDEAASCLGAGIVCGFNSAEYDDAVLWAGKPPVAFRTRVDVLRVYRGVTGREPRPERLTGGFTTPDGCKLLTPGCCAIEFGTTTENHRDTLSAMSVALLGLRHDEAHGALPDAMRSAEALAATMELWPETCPGTLDGLELLTARPGAPWCGWDRMLKLELGEWVFMKGEHRGLSLEQVDRGYLQWMAGRGRGRKPDFDPGTVAEIERHLQGLGPSPRYLEG